MRVNEIEAMYVNVKVEPPSTFTITRTFHILPLFYERAYILRAHAHNTRQETVRSDDATATRTSKITIGLEDKTIALHMHLTFGTLLCRFCTTTT